MIKLLIFSILAGFVSGQAADLSPRFVKALHMVETSGRLGSILGDDGAALGPLQIHKAYWLDAIAYDKTIKGNYSDCQDLAYSIKIVTAYLNRYAKKDIEENNLSNLARKHNGGPSGHKNKNTLNYAKKLIKEYHLIQE